MECVGMVASLVVTDCLVGGPVDGNDLDRRRLDNRWQRVVLGSLVFGTVVLRPVERRELGLGAVVLRALVLGPLVFGAVVLCALVLGFVVSRAGHRDEAERPHPNTAAQPRSPSRRGCRGTTFGPVC